MMTIKESHGDFVNLQVRNKLIPSDYEQVVPALERQITQYGKLRALVEFEDFDGWEPKALVDEVSFDIKHRNDFSKVAMTGAGKFTEYGTKVMKLLFSGEIRSFDAASDARSWLNAAT